MHGSWARRILPLLLASVGLLAGCTTAAPTGAPSRGSSTAHPGGVRFTAAGDYSASRQAETVLAGIGEARPGLHLALGDLSYGKSGEEKAWCELVTRHVGEDLPF